MPSGDWTQIATTTRRGYTEHELIDNLTLTHMNGRVYDQSVGRFLSADPFVQAPDYSQSLNRYAYVWNNPLTLTDPSGYSPKNDGKWICISNCSGMGGAPISDSHAQELFASGQAEVAPGAGFGADFWSGYSGATGSTSMPTISWGDRLGSSTQPLVRASSSSDGGGGGSQRGSDGSGASASTAMSPPPQQGGKCTFTDLFKDVDNAVRAMLWSMKHLSLSISAEFTFGTNGSFERYSAALGTNSASQIFLTFQGPPQGRGSGNLTGSGDILTVNYGLQLGYSNGPVRSGAETINVAGAAIAAGAAVTGNISRGASGVQASVPEGVTGRLGRLAGGVGLAGDGRSPFAAAYFSGQEKAFTMASPAFLGLAKPPGDYTGCGGRIN